jgi:hypothetical protein
LQVSLLEDHNADDHTEYEDDKGEAPENVVASCAGVGGPRRNLVIAVVGIHHENIIIIIND